MVAIEELVFEHRHDLIMCGRGGSITEEFFHRVHFSSTEVVSYDEAEKHVGVILPGEGDPCTGGEVASIIKSAVFDTPTEEHFAEVDFALPGRLPGEISCRHCAESEELFEDKQLDRVTIRIIAFEERARADALFPVIAHQEVEENPRHEEQVETVVENVLAVAHATSL